MGDARDHPVELHSAHLAPECQGRLTSAALRRGARRGSRLHSPSFDARSLPGFVPLRIGERVAPFARPSVHERQAIAHVLGMRRRSSRRRAPNWRRQSAESLSSDRSSPASPELRMNAPPPLFAPTTSSEKSVAERRAQCRSSSCAEPNVKSQRAVSGTNRKSYSSRIVSATLSTTGTRGCSRRNP